MAIKEIGPNARKYARRRLKPAGDVVAADIRAHTPVYRGDTRKDGTRGAMAYGRGARSRKFSEVYQGKARSATHSPGLLRRSTRVKVNVSWMSVSISNDARARSKKFPGGYRYGKRLEFDPKFGYTGSVGSSRFAWFYPSWDAKRDQAATMFNSVIDDIAREFGG